MFSDRRHSLLERLGPTSVAVFPATPVFHRNSDVEHEYRADSDLLYLTGFTEPEAALVLAPGHKDHASVLFVRARDAEREVWDGPRVGVEGAVERFGVDAAFAIDEFDAKLPELFAGRSRLYYALGRDRAFDDRVLRAISKTRARSRKGVLYPSEIVETATAISDLRWIKSATEIALMRRAAEITREAFTRAFERTRPGVYEGEVEGILRAEYRIRGAERPAYPPIVASGPNACVLHYVQNNRRMEQGDLLLVDAGAEYSGYASDVTRTFPVGGTFSAPQRAIYELVLEAQSAAIDAVAPGTTIEQVHKTAARVIAEGLARLGILSGAPAEIFDTEGYKKYFMHGTSHWLGLDVHDVGRYYVDGAARPMQPGCVLTVEPGLYFSPTDESVPAEYRGIGVRIEDDVVCTPTGRDVLTHDIPKSVDQLQRALAHAAAS